MRRAFLSALLVLTACSPDNSSITARSKLGVKDWNSVQMRLDRGMCFGTCPWYVVEVRGDGAVRYCGLMHVREVGERTRRISKDEVRALVDLFADANFLSLAAEYVDGPTDGAMYAVSISFDGNEKTVLHYSGSGTGTALLGQLEEALDRAANTAEWIGGDERNEARPYEIPACARAFGLTLPEPMPVEPS